MANWQSKKQEEAATVCAWRTSGADFGRAPVALGTGRNYNEEKCPARPAGREGEAMNQTICYLESPSFDPAFNLALEQYVFDRLPRGQGYFMLWQNENAVIIGKHQNAVEEINASYLNERGIPVVRRLSGGGAVYHDLGNLNYTFIADAGPAGTLDLRAFCVPVVEALADLGVPAELSGRNDMTVEGKKFSGNAQYIREGRVMHHGTLLFDSDLDGVAEALRVSGSKIESKGLKSVRARVTNLKPYLPEKMDMAGFREHLKRYIAKMNGLTPYTLTPEDYQEIERLREERYAAWEWNFGMSPPYSIRKSHYIEGCGTLLVSMEVERGVITAFFTSGDYFGDGDTAELKNLLIGTRLREDALVAALRDFPLERCYKGLAAEVLVSLLLQ
jgi:lipoate-protein ligase A